MSPMPEPTEEVPDTMEERPHIDALLPADRAESINGKLYIMGGGFDTIFVPSFPATVQTMIAAVLRVPWGDTNRSFQIRGFIENADGQELGWQLAGDIEAGRPAGRRGGDVIVPIAGPVQFDVAEPGTVRLVLRFADDQRSVQLHIQPAPMVPGMHSQPTNGD